MEPQKAEENEQVTKELCDLTRNFSFLNQPTSGFLFSATPFVNSKEEAIQCLTKGARQLILTGLAKASERSWDLSNVFVKNLAIHEIVFDSDDESDEDYLPSDSDEEMEEELVEYLEERLENTPTNQSCDMNLKFKFSSGLTLEGNFQQSDSINLVTGWISIKGGMPKESLVLKVNDKLLQNNDLTTLEELNVKSGSLINCFCRM